MGWHWLIKGLGGLVAMMQDTMGVTQQIKTADLDTLNIEIDKLIALRNRLMYQGQNLHGR